MSVLSAPVDTVGAFVGAPSLLIAGAAHGPLVGASLGVKDLFDIAGTVTGAGNPVFAATHDAAVTTAAAVDALVGAGATVMGKTITDELAYSLSGTNVHFGTPVNSAAPGRVPGGSSAGSAAAVAAGLVDLALGTDTGGSIRVPASYCGIVGWRPTHGAVSLSGVVPLAPSFDTAGVLGRDATLVLRAAEVLLAHSAGDVASAGIDAPLRLALVAETLADSSAEVAAAIRSVAASVGAEQQPFDLGCDLAAAMATFRVLQGREAWIAHGDWIEANQPRFGPGIAGRFETASKVTDDEVARADVARESVRRLVADATADGTVLMMPAAAGAAPGPVSDREAHEAQRMRTLRLTCIAGLTGAPVVVLPLACIDGLPLGVAFLGAPGSDLRLLRWAADLMISRVESESR